MKRTCNVCNLSKDLDSFYKRRHKCKECEIKRVSNYSKTSEGVISSIYNGQKQTSSKRNHPAPNYTKEDLSKWMYKNGFNELYNNWVESGYLKNSKPSCDRLDDYKPYTFDNLQLITFGENLVKSHNDVKARINTKQLKEVNQLDLSGELIQSFPSMTDASNASGIGIGGISAVCAGKRKTAGGFKWEYK